MPQITKKQAAVAAMLAILLLAFGIFTASAQDSKPSSPCAAPAILQLSFDNNIAKAECVNGQSRTELNLDSPAIRSAVQEYVDSLINPPTPEATDTPVSVAAGTVDDPIILNGYGDTGYELLTTNSGLVFDVRCPGASFARLVKYVWVGSQGNQSYPGVKNTWVALILDSTSQLVVQWVPLLQSAKGLPNNWSHPGGGNFWISTKSCGS